MKQPFSVTTLFVGAFFTIASLFFATQTQAQPYLTAVGVRLFGANGTGLSLQQRLNDGYALEAIAQQNTDTYQLSALAKMHNKVLFTRILNYYFGIGGHLGGYNKTLDNSRTPSSHFYGANAMIGTEFTVGRFNIAFDYMPSYMFVHPDTENALLRHDVGITLRAVIFKPKKSKGLFEGLEKILKDGDTGKKKDKTKEM
jgi:hypothetical protein